MECRKTMAANVVLEFMETHHIPMTRANYLDVAYFGNPPAELDAEEEYNLPEQFQIDPPESFE
jgi:hypothetical protein